MLGLENAGRMPVPDGVRAASSIAGRVLPSTATRSVPGAIGTIVGGGVAAAGLKLIGDRLAEGSPAVPSGLPSEMGGEDEVPTPTLTSVPKGDENAGSGQAVAAGGAGAPEPEQEPEEPEEDDKEKGAPEEDPEFFREREGGTVRGDRKGLRPEEERVIAELERAGYDIEIRQAGRVQNERTSDIFLNGIKYEIKSLSNVKTHTSDSLSSGFSHRVLAGRGQASRIIIDVRGQAGMTKRIVARGLRRMWKADEKKGIEEVIIIMKDRVLNAKRIY